MEIPRIVLPFQIPFRRPHHTDCSIHGPLYPREVLEKTFRIHRIGEGYDPDEVDDYLDAVAASMAGAGPAVTAWDIRQHEFASMRKRHFFDTEEVDDFLECIAQTLEGRAGEYPVEQYVIEYTVVDEQGFEYTIDYPVEGYQVEGYPVEGYQVEGYPVEGYQVEGYAPEGYPPGWLSGQDAWQAGQFPENLPWDGGAFPPPVPPPVPPAPHPPPPPPPVPPESPGFRALGS